MLGGRAAETKTSAGDSGDGISVVRRLVSIAGLGVARMMVRLGLVVYSGLRGCSFVVGKGGGESGVRGRCRRFIYMCGISTGVLNNFISIIFEGS